jgi:mono/diheme cytochrome c family protein
MKNSVLNTLLLTALVLSGGCGQSNIEARGFSLPEGDVVNGRALFLEYHCLACHSVAGTEFTDARWDKRDDGGIAVVLGGTTTKVVTYGDLVTSIINPSHRIAKGYAPEDVSDDGESKMEYYNEVMTVADLIDIVAFLKSTYKVIDVQETVYPYYVYP